MLVTASSSYRAHSIGCLGTKQLKVEQISLAGPDHIMKAAVPTSTIHTDLASPVDTARERHEATQLKEGRNAFMQNHPSSPHGINQVVTAGSSERVEHIVKEKSAKNLGKVNKLLEGFLSIREEIAHSQDSLLSGLADLNPLKELLVVQQILSAQVANKIRELDGDEAVIEIHKTPYMN
ncbi:hypothetical protein PCANC_22018 [Puccinia coronata f. sp. avenae]|uniref:Uncharacterized protein n=1 Tax=Puccinia coronata f. sp. avenae TaxID=200324 RepID=A0A2N5UHB6_9BASI|nr:hypothetical protein PCANC_22018 [Puccinia coronata f. sp. avenae]